MLVTRSAFARLMGVTRQTVGAYVADGHLLPPAIIGEGRQLRIDVSLAKAQLAERLDISKCGPVDGEDRELVRLLRAQRLRQAELVTQRMLREDAEAQPERRLLTRDEMREAISGAQQMFSAMVEEASKNVASQTAADIPGVDRRLLNHRFLRAFREEWRRWAARPDLFMPKAIEDDPSSASVAPTPSA
jgi:DNA-binding XRE family transcriptional regulator